MRTVGCKLLPCFLFSYKQTSDWPPYSMVFIEVVASTARKSGMCVGEGLMQTQYMPFPSGCCYLTVVSWTAKFAVSLFCNDHQLMHVLKESLLNLTVKQQAINIHPSDKEPLINSHLFHQWLPNTQKGSLFVPLKTVFRFIQVPLKPCILIVLGWVRVSSWENLSEIPRNLVNILQLGYWGFVLSSWQLDSAS